jgi:hypothetical protein
VRQTRTNGALDAGPAAVITSLANGPIMSAESRHDASLPDTPAPRGAPGARKKADNLQQVRATLYARFGVEPRQVAFSAAWLCLDRATRKRQV